LKNNGVWYTTITAPNKLFSVIVLEVEPNVFFEVIDTPLKIDAPIGLTIIFATTNDAVKKHNVEPHHVEDLIICHHPKVFAFKHSFLSLV
jgi:hypothetical protein